jgi:hypothetical protein
LLGALGAAGAQVLPDQRRGGVGQAEGGEKREHQQPETNGVARQRRAAEGGQDAHDGNVAGHGDQHLQRRRTRQPEHARHQAKVQSHVAQQHPDLAAAAVQDVELIQDGDTTADRGTHGRPRHAQLGERTPAKNEAGAEHHVQHVAQPEHTHGLGRVPGATKDGVDEEQQKHRRVAAQHHTREAAARRHDVAVGPHQHE